MTSPAPSWIVSIEAADDACDRRDLAELSRHARRLIRLARHDVQYELVAIAELAAIAEPFALDRWRRLSAGLLRSTRLALEPWMDRHTRHQGTA